MQASNLHMLNHTFLRRLTEHEPIKGVTMQASNFRMLNHTFLRRLIEHEPIKGVTSDMLRWFLSPVLPLMSPYVPFRGQVRA